MNGVFARGSWRADAVDVGLTRLLAAAGCPITLPRLYANADAPDVALITWVRKSMGDGVMLRTAQAERLSSGLSLRATATRTGITVEQVLYELTRFEVDERAADGFYFDANGGT